MALSSKLTITKPEVEELKAMPAEDHAFLDDPLALLKHALLRSYHQSRRP